MLKMKLNKMHIHKIHILALIERTLYHEDYFIKCFIKY